MQPELLIGCIAFLASLLTFFSGFGLGTLLLPVFSMFYDLKSAVLLTACVHLLNNVFKFGLVYRRINWLKALSFSAYALPASLFGAWFMGYLSGDALPVALLRVGTFNLRLSAVNSSLGLLMLFFGCWELIPRLQSIRMAEKWFGIIAFLSGLIGGFSGHQGALRTIALSQAKLEKQAFIATGIFIACIVDFMRIPIYLRETTMEQISLSVILPAVLPAFAGAWLGNRFLKKMELVWLKWITGCYMIAIGVLIGLGLV
jgi:uncharacterized membrane protein YfcA